MAKIVNATPHGLQLLAEEDAGDIAGVIGFGRGRTAPFRLVAALAPSGLVRRAATGDSVRTLSQAQPKRTRRPGSRAGRHTSCPASVVYWR